MRGRGDEMSLEVGPPEAGDVYDNLSIRPDSLPPTAGRGEQSQPLRSTHERLISPLVAVSHHVIPWKAHDYECRLCHARAFLI